MPNKNHRNRPRGGGVVDLTAGRSTADPRVALLVAVTGGGLSLLTSDETLLAREYIENLPIEARQRIILFAGWLRRIAEKGPEPIIGQPS